MSKYQVSIPPGTRDFSPEVMVRREWMLNVIKNVFKKYGYLPLETPAIEQTATLEGKYGEEGDKLMFKIRRNKNLLHDFPQLKPIIQEVTGKAYTFLPYKSDEALRYDLTVPFARYVVMNHGQLTYPFKRYQIQPVWRGDSPQRGRYREFYQCDADVIGSESLIYEAEFVCMYDEALCNMGLKDFTILINNRKILVGFAEAIGKSELFTEICVAIDKMDKIGQEGVRKELLQNGLNEQEADKLLNMIAFEGTNEEKIAFLEAVFANSEQGKKGLEEMKEVLRLLSYMTIRQANVDFSFLLARGLNYYTGTIYEVKVGGVQIGSIGGGGRYDNLTGIFGLKGMSGVGISFGADRIYLVLSELGLFPESLQTGVKVLLIHFGDETLGICLQTLQALRNAGIAAEMYPENAKLKKQFEYADKKQIPFTLVIGTNEAEKGVAKIKNMQTGEQTELPLAELTLTFS